MKKKFRNIEEFIKLDDYSKTPKYKQLVNNIIEAIENGDFKLNDRLPTVNTLLETFDISRDTIVKAYDILKENNIILSVPGIGYYIK
ncbi:MAG: winged helix-turn-helix transcriptional regulator [Saprospiraceae bacterium]|nr:winged helix-turn-helix transcriptional regulator [Saprospiraceae bacterium]